MCCLIIPGLSKDIPCHVWPYSSLLAGHQIRLTLQIKITVNLIIAYSHFNVPHGFIMCGYVWVNILTLSPLRVITEESEAQSNYKYSLLTKSCLETLLLFHHIYLALLVDSYSILAIIFQTSELEIISQLKCIPPCNSVYIVDCWAFWLLFDCFCSSVGSHPTLLLSSIQSRKSTWEMVHCPCCPVLTKSFQHLLSTS